MVLASMRSASGLVAEAHPENSQIPLSMVYLRAQKRAARMWIMKEAVRFLLWARGFHSMFFFRVGTGECLIILLLLLILFVGIAISIRLRR